MRRGKHTLQQTLSLTKVIIAHAAASMMKQADSVRRKGITLPSHSSCNFLLLLTSPVASLTLPPLALAGACEILSLLVCPLTPEKNIPALRWV